MQAITQTGLGYEQYLASAISGLKLNHQAGRVLKINHSSVLLHFGPLGHPVGAAHIPYACRSQKTGYICQLIRNAPNGNDTPE